MSFWHSADEDALAFIAGALGVAEQQLSDERLEWLIEMQPRRERWRPSPHLRALSSQLLDRPRLLEDYWADRLGRTHALAPGPSPGLDAAHRTGLWPGETPYLEAVLAKPYSELTCQDCRVVCDFGEHFLPPELIGYFAPAIVEHARNIALDGDYNIQNMIATLATMLPGGMPLIDPQGLSRAIRARRPAFWKPSHLGGTGYPRILGLLAQVDPDGSHLEALFESTRPNVAMTILEHDRTVLEAGWKPQPGATARFYEPDVLVPRLERFARSRFHNVAAAAKDLLGTSED